MRVLLTGHAGYIGSVLGVLLVAEGHEVVGFDTDFYRENRFRAQPSLTEEIEADIRDVEADDLGGFDAVVHLAALSNDPLGALRPELTELINHQATVRLARFAKRANVERFLFSSSCSVYGAGGDALAAETAPMAPVTAYGHSKVDSEAELSRLADDSFSPTYLRNATAFGVSPRLRLDLVLNDLVARAVTSGRILLLSDGTPWRPLAHVEDISRAFAAMLRAPRDAIHDQAFNVGSRRPNHRVIDLARIVAEEVPGSSIEFAPGAGPDRRCYRVDFDKIRRAVPDLRPQWTVREGVRELRQAILEAGLTEQDVEDRRFVRLAEIERLLDCGHLDADLRWTARESLMG